MLFVIKEYIQVDGKSPFGIWFERLNAKAAAKVRVATSRLENGNFSNVESVGAGVLEYKIDYGPGYRMYFGRDGDKVIVLLAGGTKQRQQHDIDKAKVLWSEYKIRKRGH